MKLKRVVLKGSIASLNYKASFESPIYDLELVDNCVANLRSMSSKIRSKPINALLRAVVS